MATLDVINTEKKKVGTLELSDSVYGVKVNVALVHQVIKAQLANRRQGNANTKTKGEVRGGGKKPFKQKGTGNARQGSTRSPLNPGGGQSFGPRTRSYQQATPKEMMRGALRSALSDRVKAGKLIIIDSFKLPDFKTKTLFGILKKNLELNSALIVDTGNENLERSGRNIARMRILRTEGINVYDIIKYPNLILTKKAAQEIEKRLSAEA